MQAVYLSFGLLESIMILYFGARVIGLRLVRKPLLIAGLAQFSLVMLFRQLYRFTDLPFGAHTVFSIILITGIFAG